jgi:NNP family nitrate/nitrite transporter-like MFS transporter
MSESTTPKPAPGEVAIGDSPRRWAIAVVCGLIGVVGVYNQIVMGALGPMVIEHLGGISPAQFTNLMMAPLLCSVFLGLLSGNLGDRFGPTRVIAIALMGTVGGTVLRIFADTFVMAFISMLAIGLGAMVLGANLAKLLSAWFKPSQMGVAVAFNMFGAAGGTGIAQATGARFATVEAAFTFCAIMTAVAVVLFCLFVRDRPKGAPVPPVSEQEKSSSLLGEVLRNPHVWLAGVTMMLFIGWQMTFASWLPTMLNDGKGVNLVTAGTYASAYAFGGLAGCIICPAIAARLGLMKPVIMVGGFAAGACSLLAWLLAPSFGFVVFIFLSGIGGAAVSCLITTAPALLPSVGPARAGTAGGLMGTLAPIGGYVIPSFIVVPIAGNNYTVMAIIGSVTIALVVVAMIGVPEFGPGRAKKQAPPENFTAAA